MQKITLTSNTRECNNPNVFLGYEGENNANKLVFEFTDGFVDGIGVLYVKRGDEPAGTVELDKAGETYEFPVKSSILSKVGEIIFQVSITTPEGTTIKYDKFTMIVKDALDSDIPMPEEYPSWIEMANEKLAEIDGAITETKTATAHAEEVANSILNAKANGEFNGKDGEDGISPTAKVAQTAEGAEVTVTDATGTTTATIKHGKDGTDGADGISSEISVKTNTETEYVLTIRDKNGSFDTPNLKGKDSEGGIVNETDPVYLADKPKLALKSEIPTKTSELTNDSSFATEAFVTNKIAEAELSGGDVDLSGYATKDELNKKADVGDIPTKVSELDNDSGYITGYTETDPTVPSHVKGITQANITNWNNKSNFSGNYNDLTNKPTIPSIEGLATSEELTQGLATKQDTLVAGNNITIENGVISATGTGEGGLAELPIASSDTLGGIKVGEGLEITEDGILSALGGGSGYVETELLSEPVNYTIVTSATTINQDLVLDGSIENYDAITFNICRLGKDGELYNLTQVTMLTKDIKYNATDTNTFDGSRFTIGTQGMGTVTDCCAMWFKNETTIRIFATISSDSALTSTSNNKFRILSIKGIKYGGGVAEIPVSSYKQVELLSEPVRYTLNASINQELALLDDVTDYDDIVFNYCLDFNNGEEAYTNSEYRVLSSNIVYNNSNSAINDNETVIMPIFTSTQRFIQLWFMTPNKIFVFKTTSGGETAKYAIKITSIKGIKYESVANNEEVITELPIASSDTLGGIKVGEGLEITEDGILSTLGGGSSYKEDVLFETNVGMSAGTSYTLNSDVTNYDMLFVEFACDGSSTDAIGVFKQTMCIVVSTIRYLPSPTSYVGAYDIVTNNATFTAYARITFGFTNSLTLQSVATEYKTWKNPRICKIIGIKLSSGGGSSYKEVDLISEPVEYSISKTLANINQDLVFNDSVLNYDEIVFFVDVYSKDSVGYYNGTHVSKLKSEIRFSNSDSPSADSDSFYLFIDYYTANLGLNYMQAGVHWKNETTLRVRNTVCNNASYTKIRIKSVKGIKY